MNKVERASKLCQEVLAELDKTTDIEERCVLLGVLTENMNKWSLEMTLERIRRQSCESTNLDS